MKSVRSAIARILVGVPLAAAGCHAASQSPSAPEFATPMPAFADSIAGGQDAGTLPGALLVQWRLSGPAFGPTSYSDALVWPMEPSTAREMEGRAPLALGNVPNTRVSPDGHLMAVTTRETDDAIVYDLSSWRQIASIKAAPGLSPASWADDGSGFYAWRDFCSHPESEGRCPAGWNRELWQIDVAHGTARQVAAFDFSINAVYFPSAAEGAAERAYVLGLRTNICCGIKPQGDPFIAVIDLSSARVVNEIPLPGLAVGQPENWFGDTSVYASFWPGAALAPDGSRLYLVDSVDFKITVIDLKALRVERTVDLQEPRSRLARIASWLWSQMVGTAEAKGGPNYRRVVGITPDGSKLLISGTVAIETPAKGSERTWKERPSGLVVVDTSSMKVVFREKGTADFKLTPNGRWLLAHGSYFDEGRVGDNGINGVNVGSGLKLIDLGSLQVVRHFWPDADVYVAGISADSRFAYVTAEGSGMSEARRTASKCFRDCIHLSVVDLNDGVVSAERLFEWDYGVMSVAPVR